MDITGLGLIIITTIIFSLIGIFYTRKKHFTVEDYITSRNKIPLWPATLSLVASAMGAWILFSPAETAATSGIVALIGYALGSASALFIFIWIGHQIRKLMPNGHALTEYAIHRYGKGMYIFVLLITIFYMGVYLTAELTGIAQAAQMAYGIPLIFTAAIIGLGTLAYTVIGGFEVSVFTDKIQSWFIIPLLAVIFIASLFFVGGIDTVIDKTNAVNPELLNFKSFSGLEFALTLIIAIVGAEIFNQGNWQRVYAANSEKTMKKSFLYAGLIVIPIILFAGIFGIFAVDTQTAEVPSVALFTFLIKAAPTWILIAGIVLAIILVMSTTDTLLNGLVSLFTVDIVRLKPQIHEKKILSIARWITVILACFAILIATKGYSVLYLFLIADLVCAAAAFPTILGLFSKKYSGKSAVISTIIGIVAGLLFFPDQSFTKSVVSYLPFFSNIPFLQGNLFYSFLIASLITIVISPIFLYTDKEFDFSKLNENVKTFDQNKNA